MSQYEAMHYSKESILELLDKAQEEGFIPVMSIEWGAYFGGSQVTVYLNDQYWAIFFEWLGFYDKERSFGRVATCVSNALEGFFRKEEKPSIVMEESTWRPLFKSKKPFKFIGDPFNFEVKLKGRIKRFKLTKQDYHIAAISLEDDYPPMAAKLMKMVAYECPETLFYSQPPKDWMREIQNKSKTELKFFISTENYILNESQWSLPSGNSDFKLLAKSMEKGDRYKCRRLWSTVL